MVSKKKLIIPSVAIITLAGIGAAIYLYNGTNVKPKEEHKQVKTIKLPEKSITTSNVITQPTTTEVPTTPSEHIYTAEEVVSILSSFYFKRDQNIDIDVSKTELKQIIANESIYNTLIDTLIEYKSDVNTAIQNKDFGTWNKDNPNNYPFTLTADTVLRKEDVKVSDQGVNWTMLYIKQEIPDGGNSMSKGYIKISFMQDEKGKIISYSQSDFIDEKTLE